MKCKCDHRDLTGYKEETDKRYFREEMELYSTKCATCKILFADVADEEKECLVPSSNQGTYFCSGRIQYNCRYAFVITVTYRQLKKVDEHVVEI